MNAQFKLYARSLLFGIAVGGALAVTFAAGFLARDVLDTQFGVKAAASYPLLSEADGLLQNFYLRPMPAENVREYAAIRGVMDSLGDQNTFFIDPPVAASESDALAGTYGGIGVQLQRSIDGDYILFPFADSPALAAGIQDGDILVTVNGVTIDNTMQQDAVDQLLRGEVKAESGVELTIRQVDGTEFTEFILFGVINVPSVVWRVLPEAPTLGYVHILRFTNRTPSETEAALTALREAGIQALILDLRDNGGGLLQESITVAGQFLDGEVVLYEVTNKDEKTFTAEQDGLMTDLPMVVLVNEWTASASELVAGALLDHERAILIGRKTYGKGTIQQIFQLSDQSSIHVTSAEWFTPARRALDGVGLEPTISLTPDPSGGDIDLAEGIRYLEQQLTQ
ncbi:MAG: PDZ domain-containing protein [Armatimonadetes bacterium]|nr:PDZ domain-containing protein [Anaerolineae bacterium]